MIEALEFVMSTTGFPEESLFPIRWTFQSTQPQVPAVVVEQIFEVKAASKLMEAVVSAFETPGASSQKIFFVPAVCWMKLELMGSFAGVVEFISVVVDPSVLVLVAVVLF